MDPNEALRLAEENASAGAEQHIRLTTDFDGAQRLAVTRISPSHFLIDIGEKDRGNWFVFRVDGAAGRRVRVDVRRAVRRLSWAVMNPVYAYASDPADPALFVSHPDPLNRPLIRALNGALLPVTDGVQQWRFIEDCWFSNQTLSFTQLLDRSPAIIAMKYPYVPDLSARLLEAIAHAGRATLITIGRSTGGRPLQAIQIGSDPKLPATAKPCVVILACELGNQSDAGWTATGAARFLVSDDPEAVRLRDACTFLILPMLDPDSAAKGVYTDDIYTYSSGGDTVESFAYEQFFRDWIIAGHRLDVILSLHSSESAEPYQVLRTGNNRAQRELAAALESDMKVRLPRGVRIGRKAEAHGRAPYRLPWFLDTTFGASDLDYEVNSQCVDGHATLQDIKRIGAAFAASLGEFVTSEESQRLRDEADRGRLDWLAKTQRPSFLRTGPMTKGNASNGNGEAGG